MSSGVVSDSGRAGADLEVNLKVEAGAIILGCVSLRPIVGEKGAFFFFFFLLVVCFFVDIRARWDWDIYRNPRGSRLVLWCRRGAFGA